LFEQLPPADRAAFADATNLISQYGAYAGAEAAARARKSRETGNILHFCRWRQAERAVAMVVGEQVVGTIH
jgi:hypothetical protein